MSTGTLKTRISKLEIETSPPSRNITVDAADGLDDVAIDVILADHGVVPSRADLVVYLQRLIDVYEDKPPRVAVNGVEQQRLSPQ